MSNPEAIAETCRNAGYTDVTVEPPTPAYRGSTEPARSKVIVNVGGTLALATSDHRDKLAGIMRVQNQIHEAAQILRVLPASGENHVALVERTEGTLIWEMEDGRPALSSVAQALNGLVQNLRSTRLVHADLRPWNIIYSQDAETLRCIDWGFSFFVGGLRYGSTDDHLRERRHQFRDEEEIDKEDVSRMIEVLRSPDRL
jgi:hypothetical protein